MQMRVVVVRSAYQCRGEAKVMVDERRHQGHWHRPGRKSESIRDSGNAEKNRSCVSRGHSKELCKTSLDTLPVKYRSGQRSFGKADPVRPTAASFHPPFQSSAGCSGTTIHPPQQSSDHDQRLVQCKNDFKLCPSATALVSTPHHDFPITISIRDSISKFIDSHLITVYYTQN
jgi:hypothetical protein